MIHLQVKRTVRLPIEKSTLLQAAQFTLDAGAAKAGTEMSIIIGDDRLLKRLNKKYRSVAATTDVLSFPANELDPDTQSLYLGDVVISLPRADDQAKNGNHPLEEELQLLVVHGTLHLLGYDHLEQVDKQKMQILQEKILNQLGVKLDNTL